jgi:lipopolysaccharide biosynthesis glycosyltransferase
MINVALAADRNYLNYVLAATASILYKTQNRDILLYALYEDLTIKDLEKFSALSRVKRFMLCQRLQHQMGSLSSGG